MGAIQRSLNSEDKRLLCFNGATRESFNSEDEHPLCCKIIFSGNDGSRAKKRQRTCASLPEDALHSARIRVDLRWVKTVHVYIYIYIDIYRYICTHQAVASSLCLEMYMSTPPLSAK